jgi:hypothetical protein
MSRKATKKAALASLKSARLSGLTRFNASDDEDADDQAGPKSALDAVQFSDPEDVYETLTESEYRAYVERKREREDFVVDDDGLGYHDDGEYDIRTFGGESENNGDSWKKKKRGNGTAALTKEALRRARKNKAAGEGKGEFNCCLFLVHILCAFITRARTIFCSYLIAPDTRGEGNQNLNHVGFRQQGCLKHLHFHQTS